MSGEWKPGTVVRATVRDKCDVLVVSIGGDLWLSAPEVRSCFSHRSGRDVTDIRPQIVLDPADPDVARFLRGTFTSDMFADLQAKMRAQIEPPAPPKPDEPQGLGAVVIDTAGRRWVRAGDDYGGQLTDNWRCADGPRVGDWQSWDRIDVTSEGIA